MRSTENEPTASSACTVSSLRRCARGPSASRRPTADGARRRSGGEPACRPAPRLIKRASLAPTSIALLSQLATFIGVDMAHNIIVAAVIMEKGGVGKTTVALNLAVAALQNGRNAAIIDVDPQATASNWTDRRADEKPWVVPTLTARLAHAIDHAKRQGVDFIVVDTPPHSGSDAAEAVRRADVVLVPVEPHLFTLETLPKLADVLKLAGNPPTLLVINKAATQGTEASSAADHIKAQGF